MKSPEFGAPIDIDLNFTYNKTPGQITGDIGQISAVINPDKQWPLNLTIAAAGSTVTIAGHIQNIMEVKGIHLKLSAKGPAISPHLPLRISKSLISRFCWVKAESTVKSHSIRNQPDPKSMPNFFPKNWTCDRS